MDVGEDWTRRWLDLETYLGLLGRRSSFPTLPPNFDLEPPHSEDHHLGTSSIHEISNPFTNGTNHTIPYFFGPCYSASMAVSFNSSHPTNPQETQSRFFLTGFTSAHILKRLLTDEGIGRLDIIHLRIIWLWGFAYIYGCSSFRGSGDQWGAIRQDEMAVLYLFIMHKEIKSRRDG